MSNKYIRIPFYYRGVLFDSNTVDMPYSYAIDKLNELYNTNMYSRESVKEFICQNKSQQVYFMVSSEEENLKLLCEISSKGPKFGVYDIQKKEIVNPSISFFLDITQKRMDELSRAANGACYYYGLHPEINLNRSIRENIENKFKKYLEIADKYNENFMKTADLGLIYEKAGVLTAPELHKIIAAVKAGSTIQLQSHETAKKLLNYNGIVNNSFVQDIIPLGKSVEIALNVDSTLPVFLQMNCETNHLDIVDITGHKTQISKDYRENIMNLISSMNEALELNMRQYEEIKQ